MAEMYKRFAVDFQFADFSEKAKEDMYLFESKGTPLPAGIENGYALGKKWMDVTIAMWREDLKSGILFRHELLDNSQGDGYPEWFLTKIGV